MNLFFTRVLGIAAVSILMLQIPGYTQTAAELTNDWCVTHEMYEQQLNINPELRAKVEQWEKEGQENMNKVLNNKSTQSTQKGSSVVKIIPVVFHVIHEGGPENISRAQLENQIDILNADFRRLNADTSATPAVFKPLSGDTEVEFKIATLDPNGNCTDGVVRVYSSLTNSASPRDLVKGLSYWPSNKYLNIWIVKSIAPSSGTVGIVAGYAQFPGIGSTTTDGVVFRHDFTGAIGTANASNAGRTATHEVGHWLGLYHIWGDDGTACTGSDQVSDTPNQAGPNQTTCPSWPKISCSNGPNGEMFTNYMDYTRGNCQNMFSVGQSNRMNAVLNGSFGGLAAGRPNLYTPANLIATGTDPGSTPTLCAPVAAFNFQNQTICEGTSLTFTDGSWNGTPDTWSWSFPGGTPSTSSDQNPFITYNTPGVYDVTLTVSNVAGSDTYTATGIIKVEPAVGSYGIPFAESFENIAFPGTDWQIENENGNTWEQNTLAAKTGANSIYINNYSGNPPGTDVFITPAYNLSWSTAHSLTFELAFAIRSTSSTDQLKVYASTTCGQIWNIRYTKAGASLATAGLVSQPFFPTAGQWATQSASISSSSYNNKPNVRFKFEYTQNSGNNIFIDDINIDGTVGIDESFAESLNLNVYPNPAQSVATVSFNLEGSHKVYIDVIDVMGKVVNKITEMELNAGEYQFELPANLANGLYSVRLFIDGRSTSKNILINQ